MMRFLALASFSVLIGLAAGLLGAEALLRFLPVNEPMMTQPVNADAPIMRFAPNRDLTWSRGWRFHRVNRVHVNNYGFVADYDYRPDGPGPLVAVIGDSFIEAAMVPFPETLTGRLLKRLDGKARVYAFAASGAPLSQYLAWADHARREFRPDALVVNIVGNDFHYSLLRYNAAPGFHLFADDGQGGLKLSRMDYAPGLMRRIARRSALAMYLATNLNLPAAWERLKRGAPTPMDMVGNVPARLGAEAVRETIRAIDAFLAMAPDAAGLPPGRIVLAVDANRPGIYQGRERHGSFFGKMRARLLARAREEGFETVDLSEAFNAAWKRDAKAFEFPDDGHWNAHGHAVAADAVGATAVIRALASQ